MKQPVKIHWSELPTRVFWQEPDPRMLIHKGYAIVKPLDIWGKRDIYEVTYDRSYVVEWLARKVFLPLESFDHETINALLSDAQSKKTELKYAQRENIQQELFQKHRF